MSPLNSKDNKIVKTVAKKNEPVTIINSFSLLSTRYLKNNSLIPSAGY